MKKLTVFYPEDTIGVTVYSGTNMDDAGNTYAYYSLQKENKTLIPIKYTDFNVLLDDVQMTSGKSQFGNKDIYTIRIHGLMSLKKEHKKVKPRNNSIIKKA